MTECNGFGDFCRAVSLIYTKKALRQYKGEDADWILKHFKRISRVEAIRKRSTHSGYFYKCDAFDPEKNICTMYAERPRMCREFPWYEREPVEEAIYCYPNCSYHADLEV